MHQMLLHKKQMENSLIINTPNGLRLWNKLILQDIEKADSFK